MCRSAGWPARPSATTRSLAWRWRSAWEAVPCWPRPPCPSTANGRCSPPCWLAQSWFGYLAVEALSLDSKAGNALLPVLAAQLLYVMLGLAVFGLAGFMWLRDYRG